MLSSFGADRFAEGMHEEVRVRRTGSEIDVGLASATTDVVLAWFNPETHRWESPAPWSPLYVANKDSERLLPRDRVAVVQRPAPHEVRRLRLEWIAEHGPHQRA